MLLRLVLVRVGVQFGSNPLLLWVLVVSLWPYALWFGVMFPSVVFGC